MFEPSDGGVWRSNALLLWPSPGRSRQPRARRRRHRASDAPPGPGDPTHVRPSGGSHAYDIAAGQSGELYVITRAGESHDVRVVDGPGTPRILQPGSGGVEVDSSGDILWASYHPFPTGPTLERLSPATGTRTLIVNLGGYPNAITLDSAGTIWITKYNSGGRNYSGHSSMDQFDRAGQVLSSIHWRPAVSVRGLAFSPAGVLHIIANGRVTVLDRTAPDSLRAVFQPPSAATSLAFDSLGNIYLTTVANGILRLSSDYELLDNPFAITNLTAAVDVAFMRDRCGRMTRRLVATAGANIVEVDTSAIPAPGFNIGPEPSPVSLDDDAVIAHLMQGARLNPRQVCHVDENGNNNGRFDIGDVSVWLELDE